MIDIQDQDTVYIRFPSKGDTTDPWALSTSELRAELQKRNAYKPNLLPDQLVYIQKERETEEARNN
jgi:hypothetical protein